MVRTKVYSSLEADFSLKYIEERSISRRILMGNPDHFLRTKIIKSLEEDKFIKSDLSLIKKQWEELNAIYHWLKDKEFLQEVLELDSWEGFETTSLIAEKVFSWKASEYDSFYFLSNPQFEKDKRQIDYISDFYQNQGYKHLDYDGKSDFAGSLDLIPHLSKRIIFAGIKTDQEIDCYEYITHILQTPIIVLEIVDSRFKYLSECFLQIDDKNALYYSEAFSEETQQYLQNTFERIIDLPEDEVLNYALMADLHSGKNGKVALMQIGNSLTSKVLKKFDYKIIDVNISEFNKFGIGIKHLRAPLF